MVRQPSSGAEIAERHVEAAVWTLRRLDTEAEMGWLGGYDPERVRREAGEAVGVLARSVDAAPLAYRDMLARNYVLALAER